MTHNCGKAMTDAGNPVTHHHVCSLFMSMMMHMLEDHMEDDVDNKFEIRCKMEDLETVGASVDDLQQTYTRLRPIMQKFGQALGIDVEDEEFNFELVIGTTPVQQGYMLSLHCTGFKP